ncbi:class I SAM-dependent methyltransferase [Rivibacter subsaxonicus]|nr:class I SAM-dependent methyltransferase [Rivibacter subsaxonicus]
MRFARHWPAGSRVLDLACGSGRHVRALAALGHRVTAADRDAAALAGLQGVAAELLAADLESGPWPLEGRRFDAVIVTNYLWRPRLEATLACVAPGGWWLHETFAAGNASVGRPSNPDFLLQPGELLALAAREGLRVVAYEDGFVDGPPRFVQRIAALREDVAPGAAPPRNRLD